jgi:fumarylacetoacetate (FAA) hydrolase
VRYVTFRAKEAGQPARLGAVVGERVVDLPALAAWAGQLPGGEQAPLPLTMMGLIQAGPPAWLASQQVLHRALGEGWLEQPSAAGPLAWPLVQAKLLPPLPRPMSIRDFYAFESHVASARAARGKDMPPVWYELPTFYFSNAHAAFGPEEEIRIPRYSQMLDYELEVACVIGQGGRDIPVDRAGAFIFGYMVFNDWSARDRQRREMEIGLGPAKGKDFASSFGPAIVTPDELEDRSTDRPGVYDLVMTARVNGQERSRGNWRDIHYSFGEMIAYASDEVFLLPGEVLGSGTVGSGSLLELTGGQGPWLQPGDVVELEIERLGILRNTIGAGRGPSGASGQQAS